MSHIEMIGYFVGYPISIAGIFLCAYTLPRWAQERSNPDE